MTEREAAETCARYFGSDGTLCSSHNGRFSAPSETRCDARAAAQADGGAEPQICGAILNCALPTNHEGLHERGDGIRWSWHENIDHLPKRTSAAQADTAPGGGPPVATPDVERPEIVCLCGSTRFYDEFQAANYDLTMLGKIVLSVGFYPHSKAVHGHGEGVGHDSTEKESLDELHKRKIDLADRVYVLNVGGYIGSSTRSEIEYAVAHGKPVDYLEKPR